MANLNFFGGAVEQRLDRLGDIYGTRGVNSINPRNQSKGKWRIPTRLSLTCSLSFFAGV